MKIAAFGDIHSNHFALEACLARAEALGADEVVFLGDYVSDCACPQKTLALLRQAAIRWPCRQIRGNREEYLLAHADHPGDGWSRGSQSGSLLYTYENLTPADLEAFRRMPISMTVRPDGAAPFEICHGAPWRTRWMLLPGTSQADEALAAMRTGLLLCAHTHEAFVLERDGRMIVNGGAVGVPTNGQRDAGFAMIESVAGQWRAELVRVRYDVEAAVREFRESGFMDAAGVWARAVAATLRTGGRYQEECIRLVERYAREAGPAADREALWQRAAKALGI